MGEKITPDRTFTDGTEAIEKAIQEFQFAVKVGNMPEALDVARATMATVLLSAQGGSLKRDITVTFTSDELTVLSDILRRQEPGNYFTGKAEFQDAMVKVNLAKWESYGNAQDVVDAAATREWVNENWPLVPEFNIRLSPDGELTPVNA
jgi:hypothetical protein